MGFYTQPKVDNLPILKTQTKCKVSYALFNSCSPTKTLTPDQSRLVSAVSEATWQCLISLANQKLFTFQPQIIKGRVTWFGHDIYDEKLLFVKLPVKKSFSIYVYRHIKLHSSIYTQRTFTKCHTYHVFEDIEQNATPTSVRTYLLPSTTN
jgi:hypothetical protein